MPGNEPIVKLAEYAKANITVFEYAGKNNNPVLLVRATEKLKTQRASIDRDAVVSTLMSDFGIDEEKAKAVYAKMQATKQAQKASK